MRMFYVKTNVDQPVHFESVGIFLSDDRWRHDRDVYKRQQNMSKQDIEIIEQDIAALYLGNLKTVEFDLELPAKGANGSAISWKSSDVRYLEDTGRVHQLAYGKGKREVVLTAIFSYGSEELVREYPVTVLEKKNDIDVYKRQGMHSIKDIVHSALRHPLCRMQSIYTIHVKHC